MPEIPSHNNPQLVPHSEEAVAADKLKIKTKMPRTYAYITKVADRVGDEAFKNVHRGLRGLPNCFFAYENKVAVGTVFTETDVLQEIIAQMMQHGAEYFCVLKEPHAS